LRFDGIIIVLEVVLNGSTGNNVIQIRVLVLSLVVVDVMVNLLLRLGLIDRWVSKKNHLSIGHNSNWDILNLTIVILEIRISGILEMFVGSLEFLFFRRDLIFVLS
jgi:hypothetical protein